jgi:hypothetical protein
VLTNLNDDMQVMREKIFGPILPVLEYDRLDDASALVRARERPLYTFGLSTIEQNRELKRTHAGGVTLNDWGWHVFQHDLPFGGVGNSGMKPPLLRLESIMIRFAPDLLPLANGRSGVATRLWMPASTSSERCSARSGCRPLERPAHKRSFTIAFRYKQLQLRTIPQRRVIFDQQRQVTGAGQEHRIPPPASSKMVWR